VAVNTHSKIFICDANNNRIQCFDKNGVFEFTFGSHGAEAGHFDNPFCVAADSKLRIIVSDVNNHRVEIFNEHGKYQATIRSTPLWSPRGVVVDQHDRIIVVDGENDHATQVFSPEGALLLKYDAETGPYEGHKYVAVDKRNGNVLLTDTARNCIRVYGPDGSLLKTHAYPAPFDVAVERNGHIVMIDNNSGLKAFDENMTLLHQFAQHLFRHTPTASAMGIAIDQHDGTITVAEANSDKVHKLGFYEH